MLHEHIGNVATGELGHHVMSNVTVRRDSAAMERSDYYRAPVRPAIDRRCSSQPSRVRPGLKKRPTRGNARDCWPRQSTQCPAREVESVWPIPSTPPIASPPGDVSDPDGAGNRPAAALWVDRRICGRREAVRDGKDRPGHVRRALGHRRDHRARRPRPCDADRRAGSGPVPRRRSASSRARAALVDATAEGEVEALLIPPDRSALAADRATPNSASGSCARSFSGGWRCSRAAAPASS